MWTCFVTMSIVMQYFSVNKIGYMLGLVGVYELAIYILLGWFPSEYCCWAWRMYRMSDEGTGPETDSNILLLMFGQGDSDSLIWNILNRYMSYVHISHRGV